MYTPADFAKYLRSLTWWLHAANMGWTERDLSTLISLLGPSDEILGVSRSAIDIRRNSVVRVSGWDRDGAVRVHEIARSVDTKFYANVVPDSRVEDGPREAAAEAKREPVIWLEMCDCRNANRHEYTCELYHRRFEPAPHEVAAGAIQEEPTAASVAVPPAKKRDKKAPLPGQTKMF